MHDISRERAQAWARLLEESADPEGRPRATRSIHVARDECRTARVAVTGALDALDRASHRALSREWVACVDEILAIADRACAMLAASRPSVAPAQSAHWPVWGGGAAR